MQKRKRKKYASTHFFCFLHFFFNVRTNVEKIFLKLLNAIFQKVICYAKYLTEPSLI